MAYLIGILTIILAAVLMLPEPPAHETPPPESDEIRQLRHRLMAHSLVYIYELRVAGGQWQALTAQGWVPTRDLHELISREEFGL